MILAFMPTRACTKALACTVLLWASAPARAAEPAALAGTELSVDGMTYVASAGARNEVVVEAGRARLGRGERVAHLEDVEARVGSFAADGGPAAQKGGLELSAERGSFDLEQGDLTASGRVRGRTADGRRFETERLVYRRATGRVTTSAPVVIRDDFGTLRGAGFEYSVRDNRFRLIGGASVEQTR